MKSIRFAVAGGLLAGAALAVPLLVAPSSVPHARADGVATEAVFNNPLGTDDQKNAIVNRLVQLIDGAPAGSRIRMAMYYADDPVAVHEKHQRLMDALAPWTVGRQLNFLSGDAVAGVADLYGPGDRARLAVLKASYDPNGTFRLTRPVTPS